MMKAARVTRYGPPDNVVLADLPRPVPDKGEVLVRIRATTVSSGDARVRALRLPRGMGLIGRLVFGLRAPRRPILGTEALGTVTALGPGATGWQTGDEVVVFTGMRMGTHAEYLTIPADGAIIPRPDALSDAEATALCFGGTTALNYLRDKARLAPGQSVLILGAAGCVGSAAVQIARAMGGHVTASCSEANGPDITRLGAETVLDTRTTAAGGPFDIVMDCVGATTFRAALPLLAPGGRYLAVAADLPQMLASLIPGPQGKRAIGGPAPERRADMEWLARQAGAGKYRPLIAATFPFAQIARAHALVDTGHKRGAAVVLL